MPNVLEYDAIPRYTALLPSHTSMKVTGFAIRFNVAMQFADEEFERPLGNHNEAVDDKVVELTDLIEKQLPPELIHNPATGDADDNEPTQPLVRVLMFPD